MYLALHSQPLDSGQKTSFPTPAPTPQLSCPHPSPILQAADLYVALRSCLPCGVPALPISGVTLTLRDEVRRCLCGFLTLCDEVRLCLCGFLTLCDEVCLCLCGFLTLCDGVCLCLCGFLTLCDEVRICLCGFLTLCDEVCLCLLFRFTV